MSLQPRFLFGRRRWFFSYPFFAFVLIICAISITNIFSSIGQHGKSTLSVVTSADVAVHPPPVVRGGPESQLDTWNDRVLKGRLLKCLFEAANEADARLINNDEPVASTFLTYGEIWRWGYNAMKDLGAPSYGSVLNQAFIDLKINAANNVENGYMHACMEDDWETPRVVLNTVGVEVPPSQGRYINVINPAGGAIIADDNEGPKYANPDLAVYPDLQQWSDVVFLQWKQYSGTNIRNINWCMRAHVVNDDTQDQVIGAYSRLGLDKIDVYSNRVTFQMTTDSGLAILGSKNGAGCAYLLIQHKVDLGLKKITEVTVWANPAWDLTDDRSFLKLNLYFTVVPV